jgi:hypothetical protein
MRAKLIESIANVDDTLGRFIEDHDSITEDEILTALRNHRYRETCCTSILRGGF